MSPARLKPICSDNATFTAMRRASSKVSTLAMSASAFSLARVDVGKGLAGCVQHLENALQVRAPKRLSGISFVFVPQDAAQRVDKQCVHANQHKAACLHDDQFPDQICISGDSCNAEF